MAQTSAEVAREYWDRMMESVRPYRGSQISVALADREVHPSVGYVHLVLPFGGYDRATLGYAKLTSGVYAADVMRQIRHQTGLRLESLLPNFAIDFSAPLLGVGRTPVTIDFCASLKSPDLPGILDVIKDPWIDKLIKGLNAELTSLP